MDLGGSPLQVGMTWVVVKSLRYPTYRILVILGDAFGWLIGNIGISYRVVCRNRCVVHWGTAFLHGACSNTSAKNDHTKNDSTPLLGSCKRWESNQRAWLCGQ